MAELEVLGRPVLAVRSIPHGEMPAACLLPAPRPREVCSLPAGHPGDHEVQVLAFVTIDRFTSTTESSMPDTPDPDPAAAARQRAASTDRTAKPRDPRHKRVQHPAVPPQKPEQR